MNRLRTTFKRSRTPTGAEMKTQSSLEVPKQIRSASFDEIQLESKRHQQMLLQQSSEDRSGAFGSSLLKVPSTAQRSKSVDSGGSEESNSGSYLEVPAVRRFQRRRSSGTRTPVCVHCLCVEEYARQKAATSDSTGDQTNVDQQAGVRTSFSFSDTSESSEYEDDGNDSSHETSTTPPVFSSPQCNITVTLSPVVTVPDSPPPCYPPPLTVEHLPDEEVPQTPTRRRSIQRQEAFFAEPTGNSLENVSDAASDIPSDFTSDGAQSEGAPSEGAASEGALSEGDVRVTNIQGLIVRDIYLTVPDLKRDRAASVDSCFSKVSSQGKTEELQHSGVSLEVPVSPNVALRSRSVDIVLPTNEQARYKALALANPVQPGSEPPAQRTSIDVSALAVRRKAVDGTGDAARAIRCTPDWGESAVNGDHLWVPTSVSGDFCYVGDSDCTKHGARMKCSACHVVVHMNCIQILMDRVKFTCKPTFRDVGIRQYREQTSIHHHWVHRRSEKGKCRQCGKSFQSKLSFSCKEIVAISCSWCKSAYHNKDSCFNVQRIGEECNLGVQSSIIVPPSWIIKLPKRGSFKSSLRKSPKKKAVGSKKRKRESNDKDQKTFVIKPIPTTIVTPVIVFINPRSGGNQGAKLLQKFQWLLNPRQVFDLTQGGPKLGLELFRKAPNLRVLACGGDGTVGWVLSILDQINISPPPAVGVLPLGTGNDLARALGWGGGYTDEPISKILTNISESETIQLDRWELIVEENTNATESGEDGKDNLPLNVVNNYFSFGVDAHIALEFHEAREAHPEKFNSRLRNKMFYGQAGGKDLLKRKWKDLSEFVTLECDGKDMTSKLKEHKVHAIVFLNIPSYGGGTHPWNRSGSSAEPNTDDGLIEVVGLTTYQLPLLQAGGHGSCITQCKTAKIVTSKTIPMQVDGEACKLKPSVITLSLLNKATMLAKRKGPKANIQQATLEHLKINVQRINMADYEQHHYDKELLAQAAINMGTIEVNPISDLEQVRAQINKLCEESVDLPKLSPDWCFVDSCTAERFFRVDRAQENLHYVSDVASESLFILETGNDTLPQTPEDETAFPSPSSNRQYSVPEMKVSVDSLDSMDKLDSFDKLEQSELPYQSEQFEQSEKREQSIDSEGTSSNENIESSPTDRNSPETRENEPRIGNGKSVSKSPSEMTETSINFKSNLLEKTTDGILKSAKLGDLKMLKELHSQGYSLLSIDSQGQTALHYAARYGHKDIVKYLIACAPATILNMADNDKGQTALHKAASYKRRSICCMLVAGGASLTVRDNRGATPRLLALTAEDNELAAYLESQEHFQFVQEQDIETVV